MKSSSNLDLPAPGALPSPDRGVLFGIERVEAMTSPAPGSESQPVASAAEAVDVVLAAADRMEEADRSTVSLKLSVGGNELAVKIQVRADEVRTTFHTNSAELQSALAREWQVLRAEESPRPLRIAEPVFAAGQDSPDSFLGNQASRDGHPGQRSPQAEFNAIPSLRVTRSPAVADQAPAGRAATVSTSRLLHTLA